MKRVLCTGGIGLCLAFFTALAPMAGARAQSAPAAPTGESDEDAFQEWRLPEGSLFFLQDLDTGWRDVPVASREWILTTSLSERLFRVLSPMDVTMATRWQYEPVRGQEVDAVRTRAMDEWARGVAGDWLPPRTMVKVAILTRRAERYHLVWCSYTRAGVNLLLIGIEGRAFWAYAEQPHPLPSGMVPLTASQLLAPGVMQVVETTEEKWFPRLQFQTRRFLRHRAFDPMGPYQPVSILLAHFRLPQTLDPGSGRGFTLPGMLPWTLKGSTTRSLEMEVIAPTAVVQREQFPVMFRSEPARPLTVAAQAVDEGPEGSRPVLLQGGSWSTALGRRYAVLDTPGLHTLRITCTKEGGAPVTRSLSIRVLHMGNVRPPQPTTHWELPGNAIYLVPGASAIGNTAPPGGWQQLAVKTPHMKSLPPLEADWYRIQIWNELAEAIRLEWLPPLEALSIFEDGGQPSLDRVAVATYIRGPFHAVVVARAGKLAWLYVEQEDGPGQDRALPDPREMLDLGLLTPPVEDPQVDDYPPVSFHVRSIHGQRALMPEGPASPVRICLVCIARPEMNHLAFPARH